MRRRTTPPAGVWASTSITDRARPRRVHPRPSSQSTLALPQRLALVKYLGKYLAKGFEDGNRVLNGHRYRSSLGIQVPCKTIELLPEFADDVPQYALEVLRARAGSLGFVWKDDSGLMGWACSWS